MFSLQNDKPVDPATMPERQTVNPDGKSEREKEQIDERHHVLIEALRDERDLQAEERTQAAIDHDYYDHLQWRQEDAQVLIDRGQAPLVFNEARQTIDWVLGAQKRLRMDAEILPRAPDDQSSAEAKDKVFKYVSDANLAQWHESFAYKQAVISGLGWLEEGINTDPGAPLIYAGSEDWRNVYRDSRDRSFDLKTSRYLFRRKRTDLDYAIALLPHARQHLLQYATTEDEQDRQGDDIWYLGERLTGSTDMGSDGPWLGARFRDRSAYIGGSQGIDSGRRRAVDLIEAWYRVPESVQVFSNGPLRGKEYDPKNAAHRQLEGDRWKLYKAVTMRMRVMICTESAAMFDGKSPLRHQNFLLVPVWGYRRGRDGMAYGLMRGMRDLNDDINKRASKAIWSASSNRVVVRKGSAGPDLEKVRSEAARPDMLLEVKDLNDIRFEKPTADMAANMELLSFDREMLRNTGGVTDANLGRETNVISGKAIGLQQDQGSMVTSELPDNLRLAKQMSGRLRLSHIEQFMTERQVIRITGDASPIQWMTVNDPQPDGTVLNDIANREADYIIGERDYRESYAQAALQQMMELLGQIATYAPQVVLNVLDLVVDSAEIKSKDEWVARIRKINGQRDPKKAPTPEEIQKNQDAEQKAKEAERIQLATMQATLEKLQSEVSKNDSETILKRVEMMFSALQAAQVVAVTPAVAPIADTIASGAGFVDQGGEDPNIPQPAAPVAPAAPPAPTPQMAQGGADPTLVPQAPPDAPTGLDGVQQGIQTPTGADNGPAM